MTRYVALLRGVSPLNAKMPELKRCFEAAGFENVKTVLGSGNVVFDSALRSEASVERRAEQAMAAGLDRVFYPIVRSTAALSRLLAADPFLEYGAPKGAKRVVTFMRDGRAPTAELVADADNLALLRQAGREVFMAYLDHDQGSALMRRIERAFGKNVTTRTWETVRKCAAA